tara:strand:+ start:4114 stop:4590 length:477 start_codon:yes stop_codon:yes gene_type:complete
MIKLNIFIKIRDYMYNKIITIFTIFIIFILLILISYYSYNNNTANNSENNNSYNDILFNKKNQSINKTDKSDNINFYSDKKNIKNNGFINELIPSKPTNNYANDNIMNKYYNISNLYIDDNTIKQKSTDLPIVNAHISHILDNDTTKLSNTIVNTKII